MINTTNLEQAKNQIKKTKKPIVIHSQTIEFNRKILEYGKFQILLDIHTSDTKQKDKIKSLSSGLNHVLAKIAAKNKIAIGIDLEKIRKLKTKQKAQALARIKQNLKILRKAKAQLRLLNSKDKKNAQALLLSLGASTQQTKQAT